MKFEKIEPINQIESNLFIRHKVETLKDGELIQYCTCCGEIIEDGRGWFHVGGDIKSKNGLPDGYVYINKSANSTFRITQYAIEVGLFKEPKEMIDCTTINS